jgi:hypothetical protein
MRYGKTSPVRAPFPKTCSGKARKTAGFGSPGKNALDVP